MRFSGERIVVGRLRSRKPKSGEALRRTAWERVLASVDPSETGVPAGSILIVRSVGAECTQAGVMALQRRLAVLADSAARPARDEVPTSADAVWFRDEAELLSALAVDWLSGAWMERWWWREVLRRERLAGSFWVERARLLPAVGRYLQARERFEAFSRRLGQRCQAECLRRLLREFDLSRVERATESALYGLSHSEPHDATCALPGVLCDVALTLANDPAKARSAAYAAELAGRLGENARPAAMARSSPVGTVPVAGGTTFAPGLTARHGATLAPVLDQRGVVGGPHGTADGHGAEAAAPDAAGIPAGSPAAPLSGTGLDRGAGVPPNPGNAALEAHGARFGAHDNTDRGARTGKTSSPDQIGAKSNSTPVDSGGIAWPTAYGGALYLVNILISMGLYADFTFAAMHPAGAPFWVVLAELTRRLAGDAFVLDPMSAAFDRWAGEPGSVALAGAGFAPAWAVQVDWLLPFGGGPYPFRTSDDTAGSWARWLDCLAEYVRARLRAALQAREDDDLDLLLLRRRAIVKETPDAVRVDYRMDELAFELRAAGLDRDPGWVPPAGRGLYFHYS